MRREKPRSCGGIVHSPSGQPDLQQNPDGEAENPTVDMIDGPAVSRRSPARRAADAR